MSDIKFMKVTVDLEIMRHGDISSADVVSDLLKQLQGTMPQEQQPYRRSAGAGWWTRTVAVTDPKVWCEACGAAEPVKGGHFCHWCLESANGQAWTLERKYPPVRD